MRAQNRTGVDSRVRALALLITCLLGLALVTAARSTAVHEPVAHRAAVVAVTSADVLQILHRTAQPGLLPPAPSGTTVLAGSTGMANSSTPVSSLTAHAPPVRGPPAQALA
jgi:hypothetical protein